MDLSICKCQRSTDTHFEKKTVEQVATSRPLFRYLTDRVHKQYTHYSMITNNDIHIDMTHG